MEKAPSEYQIQRILSSLCREIKRIVLGILQERNAHLSKQTSIGQQPQVKTNHHHFITLIRDLIQISNFLKEPKARSYLSIFSKSQHFSQTIQSFIKSTEQSKVELFRKEGTFDGVHYEFVARREEGKKKLENFAIIFKDTRLYLLTFSSLNFLLIPC